MNNNNQSFIYTLYFLLFKVFELILFFIPIIPREFWVRVVIIIVYFIGHYYGVQIEYRKYKQGILDHSRSLKVV